MASGRYVVGVKAGGPDDHMKWAMDEAQRNTAGLLLVHAWQGGIDPEIPDPVPGNEHEAQQVLNAAVASVAARGVPVDGFLYPGFPGYGLVSYSASADLLVVGSSQRSLLSRSMRGSVSVYCVQHSKCPVVVVPNSG
jgi:nucleotide-binding universal stress UspA family protein